MKSLGLIFFCLSSFFTPSASAADGYLLLELKKVVLGSLAPASNESQKYKIHVDKAFLSQFRTAPSKAIDKGTQLECRAHIDSKGTKGVGYLQTFNPWGPSGKIEIMHTPYGSHEMMHATLSVENPRTDALSRFKDWSSVDAGFYSNFMDHDSSDVLAVYLNMLTEYVDASDPRLTDALVASISSSDKTPFIPGDAEVSPFKYSCEFTEPPDFPL